MNRDTTIWTIVFVIGLIMLGFRAMQTKGLFGTAYVKVTEMSYAEVTKTDGEKTWVNVNKAEALALADAIRDVRENVHYCTECFYLAEQDICEICGNSG